MLATSQIAGAVSSGIVALLCYVALDFRAVLDRFPILLKAVFCIPGLLGLTLLLFAGAQTFVGAVVCMLPVLTSLYLVRQVSRLSTFKGSHA
jgi:hypothetical protein